jgi:hypothetical protein
MDALLEAAGAALGVTHDEQVKEDVADQQEAENTGNRYGSSFRSSSGNAKWFVDGCSYFWAVAQALEREPSQLPFGGEPRD